MEEVREVEGSTNESDSDYDEGQDTKGSNKDDAKSLEEEGKQEDDNSDTELVWDEDARGDKAPNTNFAQAYFIDADENLVKITIARCIGMGRQGLEIESKKSQWQWVICLQTRTTEVE